MSLLTLLLQTLSLSGFWAFEHRQMKRFNFSLSIDYFAARCLNYRKCNEMVEGDFTVQLSPQNY